MLALGLLTAKCAPSHQAMSPRTPRCAAHEAEGYEHFPKGKNGRVHPALPSGKKTHILSP
jgi:hypothetical protein